jgi:hypothetical protein
MTAQAGLPMVNSRWSNLLKTRHQPRRFRQKKASLSREVSRCFDQKRARWREFPTP